LSQQGRELAAACRDEYAACRDEYAACRDEDDSISVVACDVVAPAIAPAIAAAIALRPELTAFKHKPL